MKKKIFNYFYVFNVIFSFLRKSHFFRELGISANSPHDIRNLLIIVPKKGKSIPKNGIIFPNNGKIFPKK
jgi:hypothetical protein